MSTPHLAGSMTHVDPVAVERVLSGGSARLGIRDREEVIRRLTARGLSAAMIADRCRCSARSVSRIRTRIGVPAPSICTCRAGHRRECPDWRRTVVPAR